MVQKKEFFSCFSHLSGALGALILTLILLSAGSGAAERSVIIVYGLSAMFLFSASALYHANKKSENEQSFFRKLDHLAIFFMIAGSYTAISYYYLNTKWFVIVISLQWILVLFGIFFKLIYLHAPRFLYTLIYLAMGWMALFSMNQLRHNMPTAELMLLVGGGIAYSIGAVFYALKKPVIIRDVFGFHEIFHVFILLGAAIHYVLVYRSISGAASL